MSREAEGWHPTLPVYGGGAKRMDPEASAADLPAAEPAGADPAGRDPLTAADIPAAEPAGQEAAAAEIPGKAPAGADASAAGTEKPAGQDAAAAGETGGAGPSDDDDWSEQIIRQSERELQHERPAKEPRHERLAKEPRNDRPTEEELRRRRERERESRNDRPTEEELRRRRQRERERNVRREEQRRRKEKKNRIEFSVILGILMAAMLLVIGMVYVLYTEPEIVVDIRNFWEEIGDTATEVAENLEETFASDAAEEAAADETAEEEVTVLEGVTYVGTFELPIEGATGYSPVAMSVTDDDGNKVGSLSAGEAFVILDESGDYLHIELSDGTVGRISASCAWVNLPDVIPSIIYYDVNADSSIFRSSGYNLPGITGEQLYESRYMNERLGEEEYCMPVLYSMAVKIMKIQQACLANGQSLKIYQTFRPYETQMAVADALQALEDSNSEVYEGLNHGSWTDTWFIATKLSNHQRGCAIDVTLVQVDGTEDRLCAGYLYTVVTEYTEYAMPSDMHELSYRAAVFDPPVSSSSSTAWKTAQTADTMTTYAYQLQDYCTTYGLSPLSSEWWHFNDLDAKSDAGSNIGTGNFYLTECLSREPTAAE